MIERGWECYVNTTNSTETFYELDDLYSECTNMHLGNFRIDKYYHEQCDEGASDAVTDPNYSSGGCYNGWIEDDYICNSENG
jgi:hypothetical protein